MSDGREHVAPVIFDAIYNDETLANYRSAL